VANTAPTLPTCAATTDVAFGAIIYADDTNDGAVPGQVCVCNRSAAGVVAWRRVSDFTTACLS
jgi:Flp pilus assembly protein TadG